MKPLITLLQNFQCHLCSHNKDHQHGGQKAGDARLPKGIYIYKLSNGRQNLSGRIMKLE
jgi:hypothetical protein